MVERLKLTIVERARDAARIRSCAERSAPTRVARPRPPSSAFIARGRRDPRSRRHRASRLRYSSRRAPSRLQVGHPSEHLDSGRAILVFAPGTRSRDISSGERSVASARPLAMLAICEGKDNAVALAERYEVRQASQGSILAYAFVPGAPRTASRRYRLFLTLFLTLIAIAPTNASLTWTKLALDHLLERWHQTRRG